MRRPYRSQTQLRTSNPSANSHLTIVTHHCTQMFIANLARLLYNINKLLVIFLLSFSHSYSGSHNTGIRCLLHKLRFFNSLRDSILLFGQSDGYVGTFNKQTVRSVCITSYYQIDKVFAKKKIHKSFEVNYHKPSVYNSEYLFI